MAHISCNDRTRRRCFGSFSEQAGSRANFLTAACASPHHARQQLGAGTNQTIDGIEVVVTVAPDRPPPPGQGAFVRATESAEAWFFCRALQRGRRHRRHLTAPLLAFPRRSAPRRRWLRRLWGRRRRRRLRRSSSLRRWRRRCDPHNHHQGRRPLLSPFLLRSASAERSPLAPLPPPGRGGHSGGQGGSRIYVGERATSRPSCSLSCLTPPLFSRVSSLALPSQSPPASLCIEPHPAPQAASRTP